MRFSLDKAFGIHQQSLLLHSRRAEILASNLANADTPNYKSRDINFQSELQRLTSGSNTEALRMTHPSHISTASRQNIGVNLLYRTPSQPSLDGNTVDSQREKSAFIQNAIEYQISLKFLGGKIKSLLKALRGE